MKAPASSVARSCAPTWRRVVPAAERAAGIATNEGSTTSSVAPDATSGWRAARDANAAQYACARAGPKYIFRLIATVLIGVADQTCRQLRTDSNASSSATLACECDVGSNV